MSQFNTIAILAPGEALGAVLAMTLADHREWRVRVFDSAEQMEIYAAIAQIDLMIVDCELSGENLPENLLYRLKDMPKTTPDVIALTRGLSAEGRLVAREAGVDEILIKPMSPLHLEERVAARLRMRDSKPWPREHRDVSFPEAASRVTYVDNVIPLDAWRRDRRDSSHPER